MKWKLRLIRTGQSLRVFSISLNSVNHVDDFIEAVNAMDAPGFARLLSTIDRIADSGPEPYPEFYKPLRDGLYEFKVGRLRLLCFEEGDGIFCTNGFVKSGEKAPIEAINLARYLRSNFLVAVQTQQIPIET